MHHLKIFETLRNNTILCLYMFQYYFKHKRAPPTYHILFDYRDACAPIDRPHCDLPYCWSKEAKPVSLYQILYIFFCLQNMLPRPKFRGFDPDLVLKLPNVVNVVVGM